MKAPQTGRVADLVAKIARFMQKLLVMLFVLSGIAVSADAQYTRSLRLV